MEIKAMTISEARERAAQVWGDGRIIRLGLRADGGVDVELKPLTALAGQEVGIRERTYSFHRLDGNGHAICHTACQALEGQAS